MTFAPGCATPQQPSELSTSAPERRIRRVLDEYDILDTPPEQGFDDIVTLAAQICEAPISVVSLMDGNRQWFKARVGLEGCEIPLSQSVCANTLICPGLLVIPDLLVDPRTRANPFVLDGPRMRFYAGVRLDSPEGDILGVLCVIDFAARPSGLTPVQERSLEALARQVMSQLELRRAHATLAARSLEKARVWQVSPNMLCMIDPDYNLHETNPAWETVLGWTRQEMSNTNVFDLIHPDDRDRSLAAWDTIRHDEAPVLQLENRYRCRDGSYRWLCWTAALERDRIFCSVRDVTAEKHAQAELLLSQEALRQSQKMEAVGQLTGGLAHDFNNLLGVISGSIELVERTIRKNRPEDTARFIEAANHAAQRAASLTHRLLAFSRRQTLDPKPTRTDRLVLGMGDLLRRTVGPAIGVEFVTPAGLWTTLVDPNQLENALLNLCINARDAMPDGGRLIVETSNLALDDAAARARSLLAGQYVVMSVTDTGCGMSQEIAARAFEPFFTTKPIGQGTGLGLSMIYGFAQQSGGQARILSQPGKGSTISLYLPRHHCDIVDEPKPAHPAPVSSGIGETVLVVDDEPAIRMLAVEVLGELGYATIEACDGAAAIEVLRSPARLDLLVTDVGLPGALNGRQVADAARQVRPGLKVLFVTGYAEIAAGSTQLAPGMAVLTKPFALRELTERVRDLIVG